MHDDDSRKRIAERRARFMAAAVAGIGAASLTACSQCNPLVCLSPAPIDAGPPLDAGAGGSDAGATETRVGIARNGKAGAALVIDDVPVYVIGVDEWPDDVVGARVAVTGKVRTRQGLPPVPPSEPQVAGIVGPYRVIEDASWRLAD